MKTRQLRALAGAIAAAILGFAIPPSANAQSDEEPGGGALDAPATRPQATPTPSGLTEADYFKTIKVVQKRTVGKARRFEVSPFLAYLPNDDFVRGYYPGTHIAFHFNEGVALEGTAALGLHTNKQLLSQVRKMGVQPAVLDRGQFVGSAGFNWAPIYGKLAYLERSIMTYDLFLTTGFGITTTELEVTTSSGTTAVLTEKRNASFQGYYIGIGQRYYLRNWGALRVELRNYSYTQRVDANFNNRNNLLLSAGWSFLL